MHAKGTHGWLVTWSARFAPIKQPRKGLFAFVAPNKRLPWGAHAHQCVDLADLGYAGGLFSI
jgi:hypothetical protein